VGLSDLKYNKIIYESCKSIERSLVSEIGYGRCTGKTTGEILKFIGQVITNPDEKHYIKDHISDFNLYGNSYKTLVLNRARDIIDHLDLKAIKVNHKDFSFEFNPYGKVRLTYEIIE
jgi:hypothetical protein